MRAILTRWLFLLLVISAASSVVLVVSVRPAASSSRGACTPRWRAVAHPSVPELNAIVAVSPTDVWAVGSTGNRDTSVRQTTPVIVHWDGRAIRRYAAFKPTASDGELTGVAAAGADDVWAVGTDWRFPDHPSRLVVMHWDGHRWRVVRTPLLRGGAGRAAVAAISANDVWVVGGYSLGGPVALHWNGRRWRGYDLRAVVPYKASALTAIDGTSSGDVWAVGTHTSIDLGGDLPVVVHWDGHAWKRAPIPEYNGGQDAAAVDVVADAPHDVWVLANNVDPARNNGWGHYVTRYDGRTNRPVQTYFSLAASYLQDIAAISPASLFLVGPIRDSGPIVVHSDGNTSQITRTPFEHLRGAMLSGLSVLSPTDVWAAGDHLIARYSC